VGLKGPGFDPRAVPKSECMFVNIYHCYVVSYDILYICLLFRFVQLLSYGIK